MRRPRGAAFAAIALTGALALAGCARDSGSGDSGGGDGVAAGGSGCELAEVPDVDVAEAQTSEVPTDDVDGSELRIGLAYDIGGRGDASFNDAAAAGLDRAVEELGVSPDNIRELTAGANESEDAKQTRLRQLAEEGFNPIIGVGFAYAEAFNVVAPEFPDVDFALVDAESEAENVTPLIFAEEEGSFLAGVAAAYESESCHVGFVGGVENPLIQKFEAGFLAGAQAAAPDITIENTYLTSGSDITGFQDPTRGNEAALAQIDAGADVVYHASGASGQGVFEAAYAEDVKAIDVDSDQYNQEVVGEAHEIIVTSMLKRVDVAVFDFLAAAAQDDLSVMPEVFDLTVDGVGYSTSGDLLAEDTISALESYRAAIIAGEIDPPTTP